MLSMDRRDRFNLIAYRLTQNKASSASPSARKKWRGETFCHQWNDKSNKPTHSSDKMQLFMRIVDVRVLHCRPIMFLHKSYFTRAVQMRRLFGLLVIIEQEAVCGGKGSDSCSRDSLPCLPLAAPRNARPHTIQHLPGGRAVSSAKG